MERLSKFFWPTGMILAFFLGILLGSQFPGDSVAAQQNTYTSAARSAEVPFTEGGNRSYTVLKQIHDELKTTNRHLLEISATEKQIVGQLNEGVRTLDQTQ